MELVDDIVEDIRSDSDSGATDLVKRAAGATKLLSDRSWASKDDLMASLVPLLRALIGAQPSMAPFRTLANDILKNVRNARGPKGACQALKQTCTDFIGTIEGSASAIAEEAASLIDDHMQILTHSSSSLVLAALKEAKRTGTSFTVICTESRPRLEGVTLAKTLARLGVHTQLVADSAASSLVHRADLLLLGADTVMMDGVVNKVGTRGLAIVSKEEGVPAYVLAGREKFLPPSLERGFAIEPKNPGEILENKETRLEALNVYFDLTPFVYLSDLITETGRTGANEVRSRLMTTQVSELMRDVLL
jgi:translation initiation factor 2B subunit (eIF-2B alpha/beta/delta family)